MTAPLQQTREPSQHRAREIQPEEGLVRISLESMVLTHVGLRQAGSLNECEGRLGFDALFCIEFLRFTEEPVANGIDDLQQFSPTFDRQLTSRIFSGRVFVVFFFFADCFFCLLSLCVSVCNFFLSFSLPPFGFS